MFSSTHSGVYQTGNGNVFNWNGIEMGPLTLMMMTANGFKEWKGQNMFKMKGEQKSQRKAITQVKSKNSAVFIWMLMATLRAK